MQRTLVLFAFLTVSAFAQHWEFEQVDSAGWGDALQMRCAPDGSVYLCYSAANGRIRVAHSDTAWHYEDIDTLLGRAGFDGPAFAVRADGLIGMACMRGMEIDYVHRTDTGWVAESTGFVGQFWGVHPKLAFDSAGIPSIAWCYNGYDSAGGVLFATRTDSSWAVDTVYWVVPQQMYAYLCSISDAEYDAADNQHLFTRGGWGVADGDPPWTFSIGTWARSGDSWQCRPVAGGGAFGNAQGLDLTTDVNCRERVCFDSGNYSMTHFCCDSAQLDGNSADDAAIQVDSLGQSQVAFVVDSILYFAYRTGYWHISSVPAGPDVGSCELLLDSLGQPLIAYTSGTGVWLAHGVDVVGQSEERQQPAAHGLQLTASVIRNVLFLPEAASLKLQASSWLLDISGRKVLALHPGANDVSRLAPGVYFVRQAKAQAQAQAQAVQKVVVTR